MAIRHSTRSRCAIPGYLSRLRLDEGGGDLSGVGVENDFSLPSINDDNVAIHKNVRHCSPDDCGKSLFTRQNRGVRGRTAVGRDERANDIEVKQSCVSGGEIPRNKDERGRRLRDTGGGNTHDSSDNPVCHVSEISCAFGHVATRRFQNRGKAGKSVKHGSFRGGPLVDPVLHIGEQHGVIGHESQSIQNFPGKAARLKATGSKVYCRLTERTRRTVEFLTGRFAAFRLGRFGKRVRHSSNIADHEPSANADARDGCFFVRHSAS
jgi:hypothetical protein